MSESTDNNKSVLKDAQRWHHISEKVRVLNREKKELVDGIRAYMATNDTDIRINDTDVLTLQTRTTRKGSGKAWYLECFTRFFDGDDVRAVELWEFIQKQKTEQTSTNIKKVQRPADDMIDGY